VHRTLLALAVSLLLVPAPAGAQDCGSGCDVVVEPATRVIDGAMAGPGDVVCLRAGERSGLTLRDLAGTEAEPITLRACDGVVSIRGGTGSMVTIGRVDHLRITGEGGEGPQIRLDGEGTANIGFHANGCAEHLELDHVEVLGTTYTALRVHAEVEGCEVRRDLFVHHTTCISTTWAARASSWG
jgi:hypothetical protein